jgi:hypothetical protein
MARELAADALDLMAGGVGQHMAQIGLRIDAIEPRADEQVDRGSAFSAMLVSIPVPSGRAHRVRTL